RMEQIDTAVRRVLRLKEALGLFEDPYRRGAAAEAPAALLARRDFARSVAARSLVLLKNEADLLPFADAGSEMRGPWWAAGETEPHVSVLAGLREAFPDTELRHARGVGIKDDGEE